MNDVVERVADQRHDVVVGEPIHDVSTLAPTLDEVLDMQHAQSMGDGGGVFVGGLGDLADAALGLGEQLEGPQTGRITEHLEQANGAAKVLIGELRDRHLLVLARFAVWFIWSF